MAAGGRGLPPELEPYRDAIEAAARPALFLDGAAFPACAVARYGGQPLAAPGARWPEGRDGPMNFIGQLDFARIRASVGEAAAELPEDGILSLFAREHGWGSESMPGDDWRFLHAPRSDQASPLAPPARRYPADPPPILTGPERHLEAVAMTTLPTGVEARQLLPIPASESGLWELYEEEVLPNVLPSHQLLGHADWIQGDARLSLEALHRGLKESACRVGPHVSEIRVAAATWRLLWQIDSDGEACFNWGDAGRIFVFMKADDLRAHRFDRAWLTGQCH